MPCVDNVKVTDVTREMRLFLASGPNSTLQGDIACLACSFFLALLHLRCLLLVQAAVVTMKVVGEERVDSLGCYLGRCSLSPFPCYS